MRRLGTKKDFLISRSNKREGKMQERRKKSKDKVSEQI